MTKGPVPKRSDQRRRRNTEPDGVTILTAPGQKNVVPATEDRAWHPYAKQWFRSLKRSGQARFYQDTDWQEARLVAWLISSEMNREHGPRAGMMDVIFSRGDSLLTTEGARRRLRVELTAPPEDDKKSTATVSIMNEYRTLLE